MDDEKKKFTDAMLEAMHRSLALLPRSTILFNPDNLGKGDRQNYIAAAHELFLNPVFKNEVKNFHEQQKDFTVCEAESNEQVLFGRGAIYGLSLLFERVKALNDEYESSIREKRDEKNFDPQHSAAET